MKKGLKSLIAFVLTCNILSASVNAAEISSIMLNSGKIKVQGKSSSDYVSYRIYNTSYLDLSGLTIDDICEIGEAKVNNGAFEVELIMPKNMPKYNSDTDPNGTYKLEVKDSKKDAAIQIADFVYTGASYRSAFIEELKQKTDKEGIRDCFNGAPLSVSFNNMDIVRNLGADESFYSLLADEQKLEFAKAFLNEKNVQTITAESFSAIYNNAHFVQYVNANALTEAWLNNSKLSFENVKFADITETELKKWIIKILEQDKKYDLYTNIENTYLVANVLYLLNHAKYSDYDEIIKKYNCIGITNEPYYISYLNSSESTKAAANSALKVLLSQSPSNTIADFKQKYETAITNAISNASNDNTGIGTGTSLGGGTSGGTSGGSFGGSSGGAVSVIPAETINPTVSTPKFNDISTVDWAKDAIEYLAATGVVSGYDDNTFMPQQKIKREEFIKMIVAAKKIDLNKPSCNFEDVEQDKWYAEYVNAAFAENLISGVSEDKFGIGQEIKREDMAVIISRLIPDNDNNFDIQKFDDDSQISDYAKNAVYKLYNLNKISGIGNNLFGPNQIVTRAQAAKIIYDTVIVK